MAGISKDELKKLIPGILKGKDLTSVTAKTVRQELEKKLSVDLLSRKKEISQLVMDYVNSQEDEEASNDGSEESEPEKAPPAKKKKKQESSDYDVSEEEKPKKVAPKKKAARKKKKGSDSDSDSDWGKKEKKKGAGRGGGGYTRAYKLSPELAELMGQDSMPRHEVVKRVWAIIKERKLYDQSNKQFAICDDDLYKVFGTKRFRTFGMMKYLKTHFH